MNLRETLNNNAAAVTLVAVVVLIVALGIMLWSNQGSKQRAWKAYYFDLNTQTIFADEPGKAVPFDRGTGVFSYFDGDHGPAVRATVYTCGDPGDVRSGMTLAQLDAVGAFVAAVYRLSPEVIAARSQADSKDLVPGDLLFKTNLVADVGGKNWYPEDSAEARSLLDAAMARCGPETSARLCTP